MVRENVGLASKKPQTSQMGGERGGGRVVGFATKNDLGPFLEA